MIPSALFFKNIFLRNADVVKKFKRPARVFSAQLFSFVVIVLFLFAPVSSVFGQLISKQLALKFPKYFTVPTAHAINAKTKTIEFFVGQDQTGGTGVAANTYWSSTFTVNLPDAISSPTMIKSAWVDYTFQTASTAAPGVVTMGLTPSGSTETLVSSASYLSSGGNYTIRVKPDYTAAVQASLQAAGSKSFTFRARVAGAPRKMENAKMYITYDYDDAAPTQIRTIKYRIGQSTGNTAVGATGVTFTSPVMTVTESSPVVVSAWSEIRGQVPATGTTDSTFAVNYDTDTSSNYYLDNAGGTYGQEIYILHSKPSLALNTAHTLKIAATTGYQMNLVSAEQVITYTFDYANSTTLMQTTEAMLGSDGNKASATALVSIDSLNIPEDSVVFHDAYLVGSAHAVASGTFGLAAQLGVTAPTPVTNYTYTASTKTINNFWILSSDVNNLSTMVKGNNALTVNFIGTMTSRAAQVLVTYSYAKSSLYQSASAVFWANQQTAYGTADAPLVNINIAGAPEVGSYRSYTWASLVNGVKVDRAANISVNPTATKTYNWNSTGAYQWIMFFDKNTNNEIISNGAYTINLGATGSNVMSAVENVSWIYGPVPPSIASYSNATEAGLSYSVSCTSCGARIGGGVGFMQTVTITGDNFGADPGVGNRSSATYNVAVGTHRITDANIISWSNTSITFTTDSLQAGDTDTDWGAEFGGANALVVTSRSLVSAGVNFYILPQITSVTNLSGLLPETAREYDPGDTDGVITLTGTRFGSSQGTGSVTILANTATVTSWLNTEIVAQVPTSISDSVNTGNVVVAQGTGGYSANTNTYLNPLRILPRITGFTPTSVAAGAAVTVNGNHFCQGASCPSAFGANDSLTFSSAQNATVFTSWTATAITTQVPVNAVSGDVLVTSNALTSNLFLFTVQSMHPNAPTNLGQWKNAALTQSIAVGGASNVTPIYLTMVVDNTGNTGGALYPQVEYKPIGTAFTCTTPNTACPDAVEGLLAGAAPGPIDCGIASNNCAIAITPTDNVYHWQARVRYHSGTTDYFGPWVSFDSANPETSTDFQIDTTPPAISGTSSGTPGTNSTTITWQTSGEVATSQVQYSTAGNFALSCATNNDCTTLNPTLTNSHSVSLSNLNSGVTYHYRVRSKDAAGNESIDPPTGDYTFLTASNLSPAKTISTYIDGATGPISSAATYYFSDNVPETLPSIQNAYIEVLGVAMGGTGTVSIQANGVGARAYDVVASTPTLYRLMYQISQPNTESNLNLNDAAPCTNGALAGLPLAPTPPCNNLIITPSGVNMYVLSAKLVNTYTYTP